jgi:hypothetical protein
MSERTQEDFGEILVDIKDRLATDLPDIIYPRWVFLVSMIESFTFLRPGQRIVVKTIPDLNALLDPVRSEIAHLNGRMASQMQQHQADVVINRELFRRFRHADQQFAIWKHAASAGNFAGSILGALLISSSIISEMAGYGITGLSIMAVFLLLQLLMGIALSRKPSWFV